MQNAQQNFIIIFQNLFMLIRFLFSAILFVSIISCGSRSAESVPEIKDTTKTIVLYVDTDSVMKFDFVYRIVKDTFRVVKTGSKMKVEFVRDSIYNYPKLFNVTDSSGKKLKRMDGADSTVYYFVPGKQILKEDFNIDMDRIDSIMREHNSKRIKPRS